MGTFADRSVLISVLKAALSVYGLRTSVCIFSLDRIVCGHNVSTSAGTRVASFRAPVREKQTRTLPQATQ